MYEFLARDVDKPKFDELIKLISKGECVAFTGAGLSKPLGYRMWREGIIESNNSSPTLIQLAKIPKEQALKNTYSKIVDQCKEILKEDYFKFLKNEFGRDNKEKYHTNLFLLWKSNFQHFITTNFDATLYDNTEDCKYLITYPSDKLDIKSERTLYHLHSRAFITPPKENEETLEYYLNNLVYGEKSYIDAYKDEVAIESFIYKLIQEYSILFIGFSMTDEDFKNCYEKMRKKWENYNNKINKHPQRQNKDSKIHYILLPYPMKREYDNEKDYAKSIETFNYTENQLQEIKINVISYNVIEESEHKGLKLALELIKEKAPKKKLPLLYEFGIDNPTSELANENEVS